MPSVSGPPAHPASKTSSKPDTLYQPASKPTAAVISNRLLFTPSYNSILDNTADRLAKMIQLYKPTILSLLSLVTIGSCGTLSFPDEERVHGMVVPLAFREAAKDCKPPLLTNITEAINYLDTHPEDDQFDIAPYIADCPRLTTLLQALPDNKNPSNGVHAAEAIGFHCETIPTSSPTKADVEAAILKMSNGKYCPVAVSNDAKFMETWGCYEEARHKSAILNNCGLHGEMEFCSSLATFMRLLVLRCHDRKRVQGYLSNLGLMTGTMYFAIEKNKRKWEWE
ncbi:hypothetical protein BJ508DRAFT_365109 [Ascobolus immersus RN42]|uniref:Uncharacterized protein n=1 Tax=Ascobolus immersus RN42 TaxID=1160509 RepID=A0A3N4HUU0_ASCIM|nr:hypothetical protein BJ508DRAFT_365109 [Ascobolus immersus RN42]